MTRANTIVNDLKKQLKDSDPHLTEEQITRRNKILNSFNPNFKGYGHKMADIEKLAREIFTKYKGTYEEATEVFKALFKSDFHEEKFVGAYYLNRFKKDFNEKTVKLFKDQYSKYCDSWAICDSSMIKIVGPFLGKKDNDKLAKKTIEDWSESEVMWIRRASMVILLKIVMLNKEFDEFYVFELVEKMLKYSDDYIQKGIGWLLKTCSNYRPEIIVKYLEKNKKRLSRLILRYASEKLPKETRTRILQK